MKVRERVAREGPQRDILMVAQQQGSRKRDEECERAFLAPPLPFPPPSGLVEITFRRLNRKRSRLICGSPITDLFIGPIVLPPSPPAYPSKDLSFPPRHITLRFRPVLRCLSIRVGFRVPGNLSIPRPACRRYLESMLPFRRQACSRLARRRPPLVVVVFGGNEMISPTGNLVRARSFRSARMESDLFRGIIQRRFKKQASKQTAEKNHRIV